ncbi:MAG: hypothetical protein AAF125_03705, partial [Chloroflexota bacterium]
DGGSLRGVYRNALGAVRKNPLILALYTRNRFVLGGFVHEAAYAQSMTGMVLWNVRWVHQLQAHGLVRQDVDVDTTAWIEVVFRQGLLTIPVEMESSASFNYETILDQFFTMLGQFIGVDNIVSNDAGKAALREYINDFKAQSLPQDDN